MTDHSYDDQRVALTSALLDWLSGIARNDAADRRSP